MSGLDIETQGEAPRRKVWYWQNIVILLLLSLYVSSSRLWELSPSASNKTLDIPRNGVPHRYEEMIVARHEHLRNYQQDFLSKTISTQDFLLTAVFSHDDPCYDAYVKTNVERLNRVWKAWVNDHDIQFKSKVQVCGPSYVDCDQKRWQVLLDLYEENEAAMDPLKANHQLYTHMDSDYILLSDQSTLQWMTDCYRYGISIRQMDSNFGRPQLSMSHACFSHHLIRAMGGPAVIQKHYLKIHKDMQIALYSLVLFEVFDGSFRDMLHFAQGSVYSERVGEKIEKVLARTCVERLKMNPNRSIMIAPPASIHLKSCKLEAMDQCLDAISRFNGNYDIANWQAPYTRHELEQLNGASTRTISKNKRQKHLAKNHSL